MESCGAQKENFTISPALSRVVGINRTGVVCDRNVSFIITIRPRDNSIEPACLIGMGEERRNASVRMKRQPKMKFLCGAYYKVAEKRADVTRGPAKTPTAVSDEFLSRRSNGKNAKHETDQNGITIPFAAAFDCLTDPPAPAKKPVSLESGPSNRNATRHPCTGECDGPCATLGPFWQLHSFSLVPPLIVHFDPLYTPTF